MIALLTGVLLALCHPGFSLHFLAPFALIPLFAFALYAHKRPLFYGWLTGFVYWFAVCYWIQSTLEEHGGMGRAESWCLFLLFCAVKALQMAAFTWLTPHLCRSFYAAPALAALWTILEWTHNYTGFAWLTLGNAAIDWPALAKLAPYTGVWGISFAIALVSAILVTRQWQWAALFATLLFLPALPTASPAPYTARAIQPNLPADAQYSPEMITALQRHLTELSKTSTPPTLIVWPEVPAPIYDQDRFLADIPRTNKTQFLAGVVSHTDHGDLLNSALLLSKEGRNISRYSKVNLVPFGEYVPWPFGAVTRKVSSEAGEFTAGTAPIIAAGLGTFICYESVFPNYIRQFPLHGARVLFNLSNDGWFGKSAARDQHFLIVRMRAIENQRWIVRVTNNGITAAINPAGQVHDEQPSYQELAADLHYGEAQSLTLYTKWGDWFIAILFIPLILAVASSFHRYRNNRSVLLTLSREN